MDLRSRAVVPVNDIEAVRERDATDNQRELERRAAANRKANPKPFVECRLSYRFGALAKKNPEYAGRIQGIRARLRQTQEALGVTQPIENTVIYAQAKTTWYELTGEPYVD